MGAGAGFVMLALVPVLLIATGLPAFAVLIGIAVVFAGAGAVAGVVPVALMTALPVRILGLLENDLLQALPLYVLMGALLNRLPLADILFRAANALARRSAAAPLLAAFGLGALLAPMNGSVGAGVATLARIVHPRLMARGIAPETSLASISVASTLGVVVPPSLVLILLGDAMLSAHTQAVTASGRFVRVINTADVFQGALIPAGLFLLSCLAWAWWAARGAPARAAEPVTARAWLLAGATVALILGLLAAVTAGYLYAVEAAATGAVALFLWGIASRSLTGDVLRLVLADAMAVTGALFALFIAATSFTLVFRAFGSDGLLAELVAAIPGGSSGAVLAALGVLALSALVLDAFEIILVVVPLLMPPLLERAPDAVWVAVLTLLVLQGSFLLPPFGYAVMMARTMTGTPVRQRRLMRALAPYLCLQLAVLAAIFAFPPLVHLVAPAGNASLLPEDEVQRRLNTILPPPER